VLVAVALGWRGLAEVLHAPIGVLGFALACAITLALLRRLPAMTTMTAMTAMPAITAAVPAPAPRATPWLAPVLASLLCLAALAHARRPVPAADGWRPTLALPAALGSQPLPLTTAESDLFRRHGGVAEKRRVRLGDREATVLAVFSRSFRAHHPPEVCLAGAGVHVDHLGDVALGPDAGVRLASLDGGRRAAVYWYQSPTRTTGDLLARIADEIAGRERRWAQISILVDGPLSLAVPEDRALVDAIRAAAAHALAPVEDTP